MRMRLWLKDTERLPDPAPVKTDDRKAVLVGIALWLVALIVLLIFVGPLSAAGNTWWVWTCAVGLALGIVGLVYTHARRKAS
jgi:FtsH-binding integral membrane protein